MSRPNLNTLPHKKCRYRVKFLSAAGGRVLVPGGGGGDAGHSGALDSVGRRCVQKYDLERLPFHMIFA